MTKLHKVSETSKLLALGEQLANQEKRKNGSYRLIISLHPRNLSTGNVAVEIRVKYKRKSYALGAGIHCQREQIDSKHLTIHGDDKANEKIGLIVTNIRRIFHEYQLTGRPINLRSLLRVSMCLDASMPSAWSELVKEFLAETKRDLEIKLIGKRQFQRIEQNTKKVTIFFENLYGKEFLLTDIKRADADRLYKDGLAKGWGQEYSARRVKHARRILQFAYHNEYLSRNPFDGIRYRRQVNVIQALTMPQLEAIVQAKLLDNSAVVRDLFVMQCLTGLAYTDLYNLRPENIKQIEGDFALVKPREKNNNAQLIPLVPTALAIIEQYRNHPLCQKTGKLLPVISNCKFNGYLKLIAEAAGITDIKLTTHVGRRTYATLLYKKGASIQFISSSMGHTTPRITLKHYAKQDESGVISHIRPFLSSIDNALSSKAI